MPAVRRILDPLRRLVLHPLLLGQLASSIASAVGFLVLSFRVEPEVIARFSIYNIFGLAAPGALRAGLLIPAMIRLRTDPKAHVPWRYAAAGSGVIATIALMFATVAEGGLSGEGCFFVAATFVATIAEWLRYRWLARSRLWKVAVGDLMRLLFVPILFLVPVQSGAVSQAWLLLIVLPALAWWLVGLRRLTGFTRYREYSSAARAQITEYFILQLNIAAPMLTIGSVSGTSLVAGVRVAQTLFGPLNIVSSASTTNLLAAGAVDEALQGSGSLVRHGSRVANRMFALSLGLTVVGLGVAMWVPWLPSGIDSATLALAVGLVGMQAMSNAWTGIHNVLARFMGGHRAIAAGRLIVVAGAATGYVGGYAVGGPDVSIVAGMTVSAVLGPPVFWLPARRRYRRAHVAEQSSAYGCPT